VLSPKVEIIDNGDSRYRTFGDWSRQAGGYKKDTDIAATGEQTRHATWTFNNLTPGRYRISATWKADPDIAHNAPFSAFDGNRKLGQKRMDQTARPNTFRGGKTWWSDLGTFVVRNGLLTVRLTARGRDAVAADAIRIERVETGIFPIKKTAKATAAAPKAAAFSAASIPAASRSIAADVLTGSASGELFSSKPLLI
jgi:hypothetical protein